MRQHENKYVKLKNNNTPLDYSPKPSLRLKFKLPKGKWQEIDLSFFEDENFPRQNLGKEFAEAFQKLSSDLSEGTREHLEKTLKDFNNFLNHKDVDFPCTINSLSEITFELLLDYQFHLEMTTTERNAENSYGNISRFLHKISVRMPHLITSDLQIPASKFLGKRRETRGKAQIISLENLKAIHDAAFREYKEIRNNHKKALRFLDLTERFPIVRVPIKTEGSSPVIHGRPWKEEGYVLHHLVRELGILRGVPGSTINAIRSNGLVKATDQLGWYVPNSDKNLLPILILLYIKTGINVSSIHTLKRDCLSDHPLPVSLKTLSFVKPRSGVAANKELSFPSKQEDGVIELINFLISYTEPLVELASSEEREYLFLYKHGLQVNSAHYDSFCANGLKPFIARNDLPSFSLNQIRSTVASLLYLQTKDIFRVQRLLNHSDVRTTIEYIRGPVVQALHNKQISKGIETLFETITGSDPITSDITVFNQSSAEVVSEKISSMEISESTGKKILEGGCNTFIGKCKDPYNSPQPGEIKGKPCKSLHSCVFCENCWIFLENLPDVIKFRNKLIADKLNMTEQDWEELHGSTVRVIDDSILSSFSEKSIKEAELIVNES